MRGRAISPCSPQLSVAPFTHRLGFIVSFEDRRIDSRKGAKIAKERREEDRITRTNAIRSITLIRSENTLRDLGGLIPFRGRVRENPDSDKLMERDLVSLVLRQAPHHSGSDRARVLFLTRPSQLPPPPSSSPWLDLPRKAHGGRSRLTARWFTVGCQE